MHPIIVIFSTGNTYCLLGSFLIANGLEEITGHAHQAKGPRYLALGLQKATAKTSEFRQLNQVRFLFDTLVGACMHLPLSFPFSSLR